MNRRRLITMFAVVAIVVTASIGAFAGTQYSYSVIVPGFNRSGFSEAHAKSSDNDAYIASTTVGGDYAVDVRLVKYDKTSLSKWYRIDDGTT